MKFYINAAFYGKSVVPELTDSGGPTWGDDRRPAGQWNRKERVEHPCRQTARLCLLLP